jgi:thymidylate synthase (FAD)
MSEVFSTGRSTVPAMEEILGKEFKILDHGFIRVVDYMGDDSAIVQAARVSYGKGTKKLNEDKGLINYLLRHSHTTPFEMCEIKFHIKMPIFVARQWIRHRTANVNEYSARYSILDKEFYVPAIENITPQSQINKQGRDTTSMSSEEVNRVIQILNEDSQQCYNHYLEMLNLSDSSPDIKDENATHVGVSTSIQAMRDPNRLGIARELARINLNLSYYTQMYWKIDLHNLMHFLRLRADSHAQFEIRAYAVQMLEILKLWVPHTYEAFENYQLNACKISSQGKTVIKRLIAGEKVTQESSGMSQREWQELMSSLEI